LSDAFLSAQFAGNAIDPATVPSDPGFAETQLTKDDPLV
jgi:hypothetical protein